MQRKTPNIVCTGQVRALPTLEWILPRKRVRLLAFFRQFPHLPVKPAVGRSLAKAYRLFMKHDSKSIEMKLALISRIIVIFAMVFAASAAIVIWTQGVILFVAGLSIFSALLWLVNLVVPGLLMIFKYPNLAYAWLHGRNPIVYSSTSWDLLPNSKREVAYFDSIVTFLMAVAFIVWAISENL